MYSPTPQGSDWLKHISTIMWGTSINRPWIPLKMSAHTFPSPHPESKLHFSVPAGENGCLLTRALAWHYDKHSLWLPVPPKSSRSSSLPSFPPLPCLSLPVDEDGVTVLPRVCSDIVSALISHHAVSLKLYTVSFHLPSNFSSIHSHHPSPPISITVPCSVLLCCSV